MLTGAHSEGDDRIKERVKWTGILPRQPIVNRGSAVPIWHLPRLGIENSTICVGEDMGPILLVIVGYSMLGSWIEHLVGIATRHAADSGRRFRRPTTLKMYNKHYVMITP
jgi:hypothetical protein